LRYQLADLEEVESERLDLGQDAGQCRPVQEPGGHSLRDLSLRYQGATKTGSITISP
jgi:hypothetical protein